MAYDPLEWIDAELSNLDSRHMRRSLYARSSSQSGRIVLDGKTFINFASNDYLGLAADPRLAIAVADAARRVGWGSGASPLVSGRGALHALLEQELARFEETEAALLFPSGFAANTGTIPALVGRGDIVLSDAKNHASIIDGCRLSGARVEVYRHGDASHLKTLLSQSGEFGRRLIVTDGLFSMDGDFAPLPSLAHLAEEHRAMLMVDEAHATGVFGDRGRGVCEYLAVESGVHVRVGTLSKALGGSGGFVVGSQPLIDWLVNRARPYVFSTAAPEAICAAMLQSLQIVENEPERRATLRLRADHLRQSLDELSLPIGNSQSQIISVILGDAVRTMDVASRLREHGCLVPGIRPPSVPKNEALLRISVTCSHQPYELEQLAESLRMLSSAIALR